MRQHLVTFDELQIGQELAPVSFEISSAVVEKYLIATGDASTPRTDPQVVPPVMTAIVVRRTTERLVSPPGGIHAKQHYRFRAPMHAGDVVTTDAVIADKYVKKGRQYVVIESRTRRGDGELAVTGRTTRIWAQT